MVSLSQIALLLSRLVFACKFSNFNCWGFTCILTLPKKSFGYEIAIISRFVYSRPRYIFSFLSAKFHFCSPKNFFLWLGTAYYISSAAAILLTVPTASNCGSHSNQSAVLSCILNDKKTFFIFKLIFSFLNAYELYQFKSKTHPRFCNRSKVWQRPHVGV